MPEILNDNFDVIQGAPFTLSISGCNASCSVILQSAEDPVDAQTLTTRVFDGAFNVTLNEDVPAGIYRLEVKAIDSSDVVFSPNFEIDPPIKTSQSRSTSSRPDPAAIAFIVVAVVALFISVIICALLDRQRRKRHAPDKIGIKTQLGELTEKVKAQAGWPGGAHRERLYL